MRTRLTSILLLLVLVAFSLNASAQRRRAVRSGPDLDVSGAVAVEATAEGYNASFHVFIFPSIPVGTRVERQVFYPDVFAPDGSLLAAGNLFKSWESVITIANEQFYQGDLWIGAFPSDFPAGVVRLRTIATAYGRTYTMTGHAPVRMPADTKLGPLKDLIVDEWGGVTLVPWGEFTTPPVVVAPHWLNSPVKLVGMNYIPPGIVGHGPTLIAVCYRVEGHPYDFDCSSRSEILP